MNLDWGAVLTNPEFIGWFITGILVPAMGYLFKKLGMTIDINIIEAACYEAYESMIPVANQRRDNSLKLDYTNSIYIRGLAVARAKLFLYDKKPSWIPGFLWDNLVNKISGELLHRIIEGIIQVKKMNDRKPAEG